MSARKVKTSYTLGLAGCGKMGSAMLRSWQSSGFLAAIDVLEPGDIPAEIAKTGLVHHRTDKDFTKNAVNWDMLVLAIKPQTLPQLSLEDLPEHLPVLSIMAGQTIETIKRALKTDHVIRAMPNTPAAIGKGVTAVYAGGIISENTKSIADTLLQPMGLVKWLTEENLMDAVTAVSGSGPAYVFYLIECMSEAAQQCGLPIDLAKTLARQTVIGAASLAEKEAGNDVSTLRENVTSPHGTTAAALDIMMDGRFQDIVTAAIKRASARSRELSDYKA